MEQRVPSGFRVPSLGVLLLLFWCTVTVAAAAGSDRSEHSAQPLPAKREAFVGPTPDGGSLWSGSERAQARRAVALALLAREARLDPSVAFDPKLLEQIGDDPPRARRADLLLTRAWLDYLVRRRGGLRLGEPAMVARTLALLDSVSTSEPFALAVTELRIVEALGGWQPVSARLEEEPAPPTAETPQGMEKGPASRRRWVAERTQLIRRLVQSADLSARYLAVPVPERVLQQAVMRFQKRHGLFADGTVGKRTLAALNEPISEQIARAEVNVLRASERAARSGLRRYVEVNIPAFELRYFENGTLKLRSRVIVGDDKTPTPVFDDVIRYIDVNPSWYVPATIVKEILEKASREPGYFERAGFVWQTGENGRVRLVQRPGPENALGRFKFVFPNHHAVYLHDTAQRGLFGRADQALSHGCIRVERPLELALALLSEQGWTTERLQQVLDSGRTRRIELAEPVPVFLDYRTVELDPEGRLLLLSDLYGHDRAGRVSFEGKLMRARASSGAAPSNAAASLAERAAEVVVD